MKNSIPYLWQRGWVLFLVVPLALFLTQNNNGHAIPPHSPPLPLPGPAGPPKPATHLLFVSFPENNGGGGQVTTRIHPLSSDGLAIMPQAVPLFSQPDPPRCQTDAVHAAPNSQALILQYNCETTLFARLFDLTNPTTTYTTFYEGYFMEWSPDGHWFLFRNIETDQVTIVPHTGGEGQPLPLPDRTYAAAFAPDGQTVLYARSPGLGFGSEIGVLNLATNTLTPWRSFPGQIIAHPAWSPDGNNLAYILMPDTNTPFVIGELWLADTATGAPLTYLAEVDAGRGYTPIWSPDSSSLTFVYRENPEDVRANIEPLALHSNLRQITISSGMVISLTHFVDSLVTGPVWSPDGTRLAFTANDAVWFWASDAEPVQVSPAGRYRYPAWLSLAPDQVAEQE